MLLVKQILGHGGFLLSSSVNLEIIFVINLFESILSLRRANRRLSPVEPLSLALAQRGDHSVWLFLSCDFSLFELEPLEPPGGDEFKEQAPNESE